MGSLHTATKREASASPFTVASAINAAAVLILIAPAMLGTVGSIWALGSSIVEAWQ